MTENHETQRCLIKEQKCKKIRLLIAPLRFYHSSVPFCLEKKQEALLLQRGRKMLRVCIASVQNVERSLILLVVSASDISLRTIKFFSVLFSSAYSSMLQAVTNKHSLVRRRLCDLHCMVVDNCFCHFVVRTSSNLR